jgi:transposase
MRYGTRTHSRRRWTRQAHRPVCPVKLGYAWGYLYVAICPFTADMFALFLSHLDKQCFTYFLDQLQLHLQEKGIGKALLVGDGATAHTSQHWPQKQGLQWQKLPTACPELNPVERFFEELRAKTSNKVFATKQQVEDYLAELILNYQQQPQLISSLTFFNYLSAQPI